MPDSVEKSAVEPAIVVLSADEKKQRDQRNLAIALSLGVFIILVFAVTILRLGGAAAQ